VAKADAALAQFDLERQRLALVGSVKRAYQSLRLARALADLADRQRDAWKEVQEAARVRYASAVGQQLELVRAQVEGTRVQALHAQPHAEARARRTERTGLLAGAADTPVEPSPPAALRPERRDPLAVVHDSESMSPELKAAAAAVERDEIVLR